MPRILTQDSLRTVAACWDCLFWSCLCLGGVLVGALRLSKLSYLTPIARNRQRVSVYMKLFGTMISSCGRVLGRPPEGVMMSPCVRGHGWHMAGEQHVPRTRKTWARLQNLNECNSISILSSSRIPHSICSGKVDACSRAQAGPQHKKIAMTPCKSATSGHQHIFDDATCNVRLLSIVRRVFNVHVGVSELLAPMRSTALQGLVNRSETCLKLRKH
jgi:hypothetical protein